MNPYRQPLAGGLPVVVKNLLIINGLLFLLRMAYGEDELGRNVLDMHLGMYHIGSPNFRPWQLITHMFMHGSPMHLLTNMCALFMFGAPVEQLWGPKRFISYYMLCGLGAAGLHMAVNSFEVKRDMDRVASYGVDPGEVRAIADQAAFTPDEANKELDRILQHHEVPQEALVDLYFDHQGTMVGASGAIFGILLAFGMLFPNAEILLLLFPIPIKAKYFVVLYGLFELASGLKQSPNDNVAHFAHLGGMIFGYLLIRHWRRKEPFF
jgi:membrane associated rhomboid family serine protease